MRNLHLLRDYAREMADAEHQPTCAGPKSTRTPDDVHPNPACDGCVTDRERDLWAAQADELDHYLDQPDPDQEALL